MSKLEIALKQHTPIIHFQHNEEGATLRATELKPKLDKFIITQIGEGCYKRGKERLREDMLYAGWLIGKPQNDNDPHALNYKVKIFAEKSVPSVKLNTFTNKNDKIETRSFPFVLANMGGVKNGSSLFNLSLCENITIHIFSFNSALCEYILVNIVDFFQKTNFGNRQRKGFGSFTVENTKIDNKDIQINLIPWPENTPCLEFSIKEGLDVQAKYNQIFKVLDFYWKRLKSGINYTTRDCYCNEDNGVVEVYRKNSNRYIKSFLFEYLENKKANLTWEKRAVKMHFEANSVFCINDPMPNQNSRIAIFARALLGLPDKFEYRIKTGRLIAYNGRGKEDEIKKTIYIKSDYISRISSPVTFKIILDENNVSVYLLFDNLAFDSLKSREELLSVRFSTDKNNKKNDDLESIKIDPEAFDVEDLFFEYHKSYPKMIPYDISWNNILGDNQFVKLSIISNKNNHE